MTHEITISQVPVKCIAGFRKAERALSDAAKPASRFALPFFPNTFMLAYSLARTDKAQRPKIKYVGWNDIDLKQLVDSTETISLTVATKSMLERLASDDKEAHKRIQTVPITSFDPKYLYAARHCHFGKYEVLGAREFGGLAHGFQEVVLFGDTILQTNALYNVLTTWSGRRRDVRLVTYRQWETLQPGRSGSLVTLALYYMSPLRRVALDRAGDDYLRLPLDRTLFGKPITAHFDTYAVASSTDKYAAEVPELLKAVGNYYNALFCLAEIAADKADVGAFPVKGDAIAARDELDEGWAIYSEMVRAGHPTSVPTGVKTFAELLVDHHAGRPDPYVQS